MIAAKVDTGPYANWPLGRFESARKLLRLGVRNAVAFQVAPGTGNRAKPAVHLRDDKAAELLLSELLSTEDTDSDQGLAGGGVGRRDLAHDSKIVDGACAVAV